MTFADVAGKTETRAVDGVVLCVEPLDPGRVGLLAAGDVLHRSTERVAAAVGEASVVASLVSTRLDELRVTL